MGHTHSSSFSKHSSLGEWRDLIFCQGHLLKQVATLKYADFVQAVEGLNTICNTLSNSKGKHLVFSIIPGTDCTTILWKSRVRIQCCKMTSADADNKCESTRIMTLKQFVQVYDSITQQCESIEDRLKGRGDTDRCRSDPDLSETGDAECDKQEAQCASRLGGASVDAAGEGSRAGPNNKLREDDQPYPRMPDSLLEVSTIFATVEQVSLESIDEGDCCICMENKADTVLSCTHTYCRLCIEDWRKQHSTCPMCMGDMGPAKDLWALPEKPNADEMTAYLMGIADNKEQCRAANPPNLRSESEEWESVSFEW